MAHRHQDNLRLPGSWEIRLTTCGGLRQFQSQRPSSLAIIILLYRESRPNLIRRLSRSRGLSRARHCLSERARDFCGSRLVVPSWGRLERRAPNTQARAWASAVKRSLNSRCRVGGGRSNGATVSVCSARLTERLPYVDHSASDSLAKAVQKKWVVNAFGSLPHGTGKEAALGLEVLG